MLQEIKNICFYSFLGEIKVPNLKYRFDRFRWEA